MKVFTNVKFMQQNGRKKVKILQENVQKCQNYIRKSSKNVKILQENVKILQEIFLIFGLPTRKIWQNCEYMVNFKKKTNLAEIPA